MNWSHCRSVLWVVGCALALAAGCHHDDRRVHTHYEGHAEVDVAVGNPPPPVIVERAPAPVIVEQAPVIVEEEPSTVIVERSPYIIVREAPPAVIIERRPPPPHGVYIWIDGYWGHDGHRFAWARGHYERPPHGRHYVPTRWVRTERGYQFHRGRWE